MGFWMKLVRGTYESAGRASHMTKNSRKEFKKVEQIL